MADDVNIANAIVHWIGVAFSVLATALASYHFRGKEALKNQCYANAQEIEKLKVNQDADMKLLSQKMASVEAELRDLKTSVRIDVNEIKESINVLGASMTTLAESQGELRGTIMATLKNPASL